MPIKHPQFVNGEIYHIIIRGIAGQKTFLEKRDYLRYLYSLYKFNDKNIAIRGLENPFQEDILATVATEMLTKEKDSRELLVEVLGFCLMPNHIHLLIRQLIDKGISLFFQKMGGYSSYFNKK